MSLTTRCLRLTTSADEQLDYLLVDDLQPGTGVHSFLAVDFNKEGQLEQVEI
jgi:hypothetical protein